MLVASLYAARNMQTSSDWRPVLADSQLLALMRRSVCGSSFRSRTASRARWPLNVGARRVRRERVLLQNDRNVRNLVTPISKNDLPLYLRTSVVTTIGAHSGGGCFVGVAKPPQEYTVRVW